MENIIKKIEALQPKHDLVESYEDEPTFDDGWDRAISAAVDILETEIESLINEIKTLKIEEEFFQDHPVIAIGRQSLGELLFRVIVEVTKEKLIELIKGK